MSKGKVECRSPKSISIFNQCQTRMVCLRQKYAKGETITWDKILREMRGGESRESWGEAVIVEGRREKYGETKRETSSVRETWGEEKET